LPRGCLVAELGVRDRHCCLGEGPVARAHDFALGDLGEAGEGAAAQPALGRVLHAAQVGHAADAHEGGRREDAFAEAAEEVGAPGVDEALAVGQGLHRLVERAGPGVGEAREHGYLLAQSFWAIWTGLIDGSVTRAPVAW
jgi:hypothetical protein